MTEHDKNVPQFFLTAPQPCPYLPDRFERKVFTYLSDPVAGDMNSVLTQGGFRRSQNIAYRPVCDGCQACVSIRIVVDAFQPDRTMRRVTKKNAHIFGAICAPKITSEQYALFSDYLNARHPDGGMSEMSVLDYQMMVEDTRADTQLIEYRGSGIDTGITGKGEGPLLAVALTDIINDGLSMVYSFFSPELRSSSLGMFVILDHIKRAKSLGLPYVYLGYWVAGSEKMGYKERYRPQEHLTSKGWQISGK
ncbi:arginyltransferase [Bartonella sp. LJL80]